MYWPGVVALWAAFAALIASTYFYAQSIRGRDWARALARQTYALATFAVALASTVLLFLILSHDFRLHYVFAYSDLSLPFSYLVSTFWAGQEGSFLLWLLAGMLLGLPLIGYARHYEDRTLLVYNLTLLSLLLILLRQSPFRFLADLPPGQMPTDGQGLNPLLQNPWMTIHPPIMFVGYAATAIPFAFAIAALWARRYDEWVTASMPWALVTVVTLGCAILLGGYWAYVTLGWGGYWGWDPVENASLVPWLASAALVHGMILQRARGRFRKLNFALAILAFVLVVYATFLTRSGVLSDFSVHSFVDLGITGWLVANIVAFLGIGIGALLWRWREIPAHVGDEPLFSRTVFFILAISALLGTAAMILLGTSAPLITRLAAQPSQVGPAFYNKVLLPVGILIGALLAVVPFLHWRGSSADLRNRLLLSGALSVVATGFGIAVGARGALFVVFLFAALFAFFSNLLKTVDEVRKRRLRVAGGYLAHVGLALMLAGIITSSAYNRTEKVVLPLDQARQVMGYTLTFKGVEKPTPTAKDAMVVEVVDGNGRSYLARPLMFRNVKSNQLVANPDVKVRLTHDVYVSPIEFDPGQPPAGTTTELAKGETVTVGPLAVTFAAFDMGGDHSGGGMNSIGARLAVRHGDTTVGVTPRVMPGENGFTPVPAEVPGLDGATVELIGINAGAGRIRLHFHGVGGGGVARRAQLRQGETLTYGGVELAFNGFDLSDFDPEAGRIHIGAAFTTSGYGKPGETVTAFYRSDSSGGERWEDAAIPGLPGVSLRLGRIDAENRIVEALVIDPSAPADPGQPMRFSIDFSVKPMIVLLWTGLVVLLLGGVMAAFRRTSEFTVATSGETT